MTSFVAKIKRAQERLASAKCREHPWKLPLARIQGKTDYDGVARVSTQTLLDILEIPQHKRKAGTYRLLSKLMTELGWSAVRVRDRTRGGYLEQVRGYCRTAPRQQPHGRSLSAAPFAPIA
jgi:hypothetical protein